ncbi:VTT domain-containing protein [Kiritimatiellaeota bacterium B1221]|nr:VTT domain-containing protein [Kiritimatiellaeota bacterium B1221]
MIIDQLKGGVLLVLAAGVLCGSWFLLQQYSLGNVEISALRSLGWPLVVGYVLGMILAGGFGIPPAVFIFPAGALWSLPLAFGVCVSGGLGAAMLGFMLARYGFREKISPKIPAKLLKFERRLESHAFGTVLVMRLLFYLFPPLNWMLGLSQIRPVTFLSATFAGMLPATFLYLWAGQGIIGIIMGMKAAHAGMLAGFAFVGFVGWLWWVLKPHKSSM